MDKSRNAGPVRIRALAVFAAMLIALTMAPWAAAKPAAAVTCSVFPGDSSVSWRSNPKTTSVELQWFDDAGNVISDVTIVVTKAMHSRYSQQTPEGATELGASFSDANGVYAVGGLVCT
jgi:hypothetical protein